MRGLTVLITNITLARRTGTEVVVRDLALGLKRRGHTPIVYSPDLGPIADELLARTISVVDDLDNVAVRPDVIHGHHLCETALALLRFPGVPAVFVCHDWSMWHDAPPKTPLVRQYLAVDETCRDRLVQREGISADDVRIVGNAVDLDRFPPRDKLPPRPRRALIFSNSVREDNVLPALRAGCDRAGLPVDCVGASVGASSAAPEQLLGRYDIVFAKARCALEAMAKGAAVVLCDSFGFGGMVTTQNVNELRRLNFGRRALVDTPVTPERVAAAIAEYSADDAGEVSRRIRAIASLDALLDELIPIYRRIADTPATFGEIDALFAMVGRLLASQRPYSRESIRAAADLATQAADIAAQREAMSRETSRSAALEAELRRERARAAALAAEVADLRGSRIVRFGERLRKVARRVS